jgi:hypothetical protein
MTAIFPLIGAVLLSYAIQEGFYFFLAGSLVASIYFYLTKQKGLVLQSLVFVVININGIYQNLM